MTLAPIDPAQRIAQDTPKQRVEEFRDKMKAPPQVKKAYAEIAKKYLDDSDPDVKAAAQDLVNAAQ